MPRKAHIVKREIVPDAMYQSTLISKFVNCMMYGGKKSTAQHILYNAMDVIQKKTSIQAACANHVRNARRSS